MKEVVEKKAPVKIVKSEVVAKMKAGSDRKALAEYYGLPMLQMKEAMKKLGLTHKKAKKVAFEVINDVDAETVQSETVVENKVTSAPKVEKQEASVTNF